MAQSFLLQWRLNKTLRDYAQGSSAPKRQGMGTCVRGQKQIGGGAMWTVASFDACRYTPWLSWFVIVRDNESKLDNQVLPSFSQARAAVLKVEIKIPMCYVSPPNLGLLFERSALIITRIHTHACTHAHTHRPWLACQRSSAPPTSQPLSVEASEFAWMTLMDDPNRKAGPAPTTSIADTEVTFTIPPLMGTSSDPCAGNNSGRGEASALLQLKGWSKLAFGGESPVPTLQNGSSSSSSSSNSSQAYPRVHIFFKSLLQWQQLCKYRMCEAGLDKALHAAARQRPLLDCFEPMMEVGGSAFSQ
eukprot:1159116-Pelagomonas_calceolata.AAC.8